MDQRIPFTSYDFWAYLSAGFLLMFGIDQAAGTTFLLREHWTIAQGALAVSIAYTAGHVVASASSWLFERLIVGKVLGHPREVLFGQGKAMPLLRRLLPAYFTPLPTETRSALLKKAARLDIQGAGEALFWPAHAAARANPATAARLDNFLNQYGFCRNVAFVALVDAVVLFWSYRQPEGPEEHLIWARLALFVGVAMGLRYLKFLRHFAVEVFTSWAFSSFSEQEKQA